ncbi:protein D3-like isoform X1 [Varroa jacobsoni]|uniref:Phosphatidylethanolamine-binding protein n=1 Tax=Varroa destructor TaxID=109461 RepID=A0A7M7JED0_VARDE|nr:protein D3-like isoform X2 [Varroa destructor]XP_022690930.1 protein D3-like isoform X1 [Varroa jacobsoni]
MEKHQVVPDVIDQVPCNVLKVEYPNGFQCALGNILTPTQVRDQPKVSWTAEPGALYTLVMADLDAPCREEPTLKEVKHWVVGNIENGQLDRGETLVGYRGSRPPKNSGLHRYVFLLYKQAGRITFGETPIPSNSREGRFKWKVRDFARKHCLGEPVAGNFYQAEWEPYVDEWKATEGL